MLEGNGATRYQQCVKCVMDTIGDNDIKFDLDGVCNYCHEYKILEQQTVLKGDSGQKALRENINRIKKAGINKQYDCILGISGGVDSTYLAYLCKKEGLRPLLVHFDNGWNSEIAVNNIERIQKYTGFDLYTYVMDWEEFRELQRSYIKASVIDIEVPTDQLIFGALNILARKFKVHYILSGWNTVTEGIMPPSWNFRRKFDSANLLSIHRTFSRRKIKKLPIMGFSNSLVNTLIYKIQMVSLINYIEYNKNSVKKLLSKEIGWVDYGGKHYESIFTRFYQGHILPTKFNVDKRKAHLSSLICSGQISKAEAVLELQSPPYELEMRNKDVEFVAKKLGFSVPELQQLLAAPIKSHYEFETDENLWKMYFKFLRVLRPVKGIVKGIHSIVVPGPNA